MRRINKISILLICIFSVLLVLSIFVFVSALSMYSSFLSYKEDAQAMLSAERQDSIINTVLTEKLDEGSSYEEAKDDSILYSFFSPEGIRFISKSKEWNEDDLKALYDELLMNRHGKELYSLSSVVVNPHKDDMAAATHKNYEQRYSVPISHTLLPDDFVLDIFMQSGIISLYNGDNLTTVAEMASSLSHEYGHHFTIYHMFDCPDSKLYETRYAELRGLTAENSYIDRWDQEFYYENHHKYLLEIAAEDYVMLMGSPLSREVQEYADVMELLYSGSGETRYKRRNAAVQENLTLLSSWEVKDLAAYFYKFVGEEPPVPDIKKEMNIKITPQYRSFNLVSGYRTFVYYTVEWDKVYGEDAVYTLSAYDPEDYFESFYPIRTVTSGEQAKAHIGNAVIDSGSKVWYNDDGVAEGTKIFVVNIVTKDGMMYTSSPYTHVF